MDIVVQILVWLRGLDSWLLVLSVAGALFSLFLFTKRGARFISYLSHLRRSLGKKATPPIELIEPEEDDDDELEVESDEIVESPIAKLDLLDNPPQQSSKKRPKSMSRIMEQLAIVKDELAFGSRQVLEDFDSITDPNAIEEAEARLVNEPDNVGLIDWLAFMYYTNDHVEKALDCYKDLVERTPDVAEHYFYMGNTFFKISLLPEAIFCWKRLAELKAPRKMIERANASIESAEALLNQWASVGMKATVSDPFIASLQGPQTTAPPAEAAPPDPDPIKETAPSISMDSLAALRSWQGEEESALQDAFDSLFASPSSNRLLDESGPIEPLSPSKQLWEGEHLQALATSPKKSVALFALKRLIANRHALETISGESPLLQLLSPEVDITVRCLAAAAIARSPVATAVQIDLLFASLAGEGVSAGQLAAGLIKLAPKRALSVLPERWARKERRLEWQRALHDLTELGRPKRQKGIVALFCALSESAADVQAVIELVAKAPSPEDLIPISAAIAPFCLASEAPGDEVFLSLHRLTRTIALRNRLTTFGPGVPAMKSLLRCCAEFYGGQSGPASSYLASTLVECVHSGNLSKLFKLLREEAIGNLDQSIPVLAQSKGSAAIKKLVHPWLLASMGLLTGLARHWPKGKHIVPAAPSLVLLGLSCYAFVSFGTKHLESLPQQLEDDEQLSRLLLGERDDVTSEAFSPLKSNNEVLTEVLVSKANKLSAPARSRMYHLLKNHAAPVVLMTALREIASPRADQLEFYPSPKDCAQKLLEHNLPAFARIAPLVLDLDSPELVAPTLRILAKYAEKNLLAIIEPRLEFLAYSHPLALGQLLASVAPIEVAPTVETIIHRANEDEPMHERLKDYLTVVRALLPQKGPEKREESKKRWQAATASTTYNWE